MSDEEQEELAFQTLLNYTGEDNLQGILRVLSEERWAMAQMHDTNTALKIYNRRLRFVVDLALKIYQEIEDFSPMFLPERVRKMIGDSRNQIANADKVILASKEICTREKSE